MSIVQKDAISRIVIGTRNEGKITELRDLFGSLPVELVGLNEFDGPEDVEETGATFLDNAVIKARAYALATSCHSMADDSGLEVEALGGRPGVLSARYAGENTPFSEKIALLLDEVEQTGTGNMNARFICSMAVADSAGNILATADGVCHGTLVKVPRGSLGFGYDPIFVPAGHSQTFGELSRDIKQEISHRARASKKIIRYLLDFIDV
jgi:XTP/dITP diphosphohydrolase